MNLKASPLALLALLAWSPAASQPTKALTPPDTSRVCLPAAAARRIDADLRRYPLVLKENHHLRGALHASAAETQAVRGALVAKDSVVAAVGSQLVSERMLRSNAQGEGAAWKVKAKKRWWAIVGETALFLGTLILLGTR